MLGTNTIENFLFQGNTIQLPYACIGIQEGLLPSFASGVVGLDPSYFGAILEGMKASNVISYVGNQEQNSILLC